MHAGHPKYGCFVSREKTLVNFECRVDGELEGPAVTLSTGTSLLLRANVIEVLVLKPTSVRFPMVWSIDLYRFFRDQRRLYQRLYSFVFACPFPQSRTTPLITSIAALSFRYQKQFDGRQRQESWFGVTCQSPPVRTFPFVYLFNLYISDSIRNSFSLQQRRPKVAYCFQRYLTQRSSHGLLEYLSKPRVLRDEDGELCQRTRVRQQPAFSVFV